MHFIVHGLWHYVIGVGKDSGVMGVGKDSGLMGVGKGSRHGTCLSLTSFHGM